MVGFISAVRMSWTVACFPSMDCAAKLGQGVLYLGYIVAAAGEQSGSFRCLDLSAPLTKVRLWTPEFRFLPEQFHKRLLSFLEQSFCIGKHTYNFIVQTLNSYTYSYVQADISLWIRSVVILACRHILEANLKSSLACWVWTNTPRTVFSLSCPALITVFTLLWADFKLSHKYFQSTRAHCCIWRSSRGCSSSSSSSAARWGEAERPRATISLCREGGAGHREPWGHHFVPQPRPLRPCSLPHDTLGLLCVYLH